MDGASVADMRITYDKGQLLESDCTEDPLDMVRELEGQAVE